MSRTRILGVRVPKVILNEIEKISKERKETKSEVLRDILYEKFTPGKPVDDIKLLELTKEVDSFVDLYKLSGYNSIRDVADRLETLLKPYNIKITLPLKLPKGVEEDIKKKLKIRAFP